MIVYISATVSFVFLCIGGVAGYLVNEWKHESIYQREYEQETALHPEMYDSNGYILNEELLSVRFTDDFDESED